MCVRWIERGRKGWFSFLIALYSSLQFTGNTDLYQRKWNWLYGVILLIHHGAKHKGDFSPFIISFQLESSWVRLPAMNATFTALWQPLKAIISLQPYALHQCPAPVLAAQLLREEKTPSAFPTEWALHGLFPANCWEWPLEAEQFQYLHSPGTHCISYQQLI